MMVMKKVEPQSSLVRIVVYRLQLPEVVSFVFVTEIMEEKGDVLGCIYAQECKYRRVSTAAFLTTLFRICIAIVLSTGIDNE